MHTYRSVRLGALFFFFFKIFRYIPSPLRMELCIIIRVLTYTFNSTLLRGGWVPRSRHMELVKWWVANKNKRCAIVCDQVAKTAFLGVLVMLDERVIWSYLGDVSILCLPWWCSNRAGFRTSWSYRRRAERHHLGLRHSPLWWWWACFRFHVPEATFCRKIHEMKAERPQSALPTIIILFVELIYFADNTACKV